MHIHLCLIGFLKGEMLVWKRLQFLPGLICRLTCTCILYVSLEDLLENYQIGN